jgi:hypothetical protein
MDRNKQNISLDMLSQMNKNIGMKNLQKLKAYSVL